MPRIARDIHGGTVYHVLNRAAGKRVIFESESDYDMFERIIEEVLESCPIRICGYAIMPTHWHFVLWPETDNQLYKFMHRLTTTHTRRWKSQRNEVGTGPLYQGRYKSFPVDLEEHFYTVMRYVERNPLTANLVNRAEDRRWSSLWRRCTGEDRYTSILSEWPDPIPSHWVEHVNEPIYDTEIEKMKGGLSPHGDSPPLTNLSIVEGSRVYTSSRC